MLTRGGGFPFDATIVSGRLTDLTAAERECKCKDKFVTPRFSFAPPFDQCRPSCSLSLREHNEAPADQVRQSLQDLIPIFYGLAWCTHW